MSTTENAYTYLGKGRKIIDGLDKITGRTRYAGDMKVANLLHARVVLSPYAHAAITHIDKAEALAIPGVVAVLTAADLVTHANIASSRQTTTLAAGEVRYRGEPVAIVLAESEAAAADGVQAILVDYDPLPVVADLDAALAEGAPVIWPDGAPKDSADLAAAHAAVDRGSEAEEERDPSNIHEYKRWERGNTIQALANAEHVIENTYHTPIVHQGYIEPHACVVDIDPYTQALTIYTATQGQFGVRNEVARLVNLPRQKITIVPMSVGGGFGAKYGIIEPLAAAAALAVGRPVRLVLTRSEDFLTTTPAPASRIDLKIGASSDGMLQALHAKVYLDNGLYPFNIGGIVSVLIGGYYRCENVLIEVHEVITHKPPSGAYRAPGAPQATFAIESSMDDLASALKMDPIELRLLNAVSDGDLMGNGEPWPSTGMRKVLEVAKQHPLWEARNSQPDVGVGLAVGGWPCGTTPAAAVCRVDTDGMVRVHVGSVDVSGVHSSFVLIAAEIIGISPDQVEIVAGDTRTGPYAGASGGSQITYSVSGAVAESARAARRQLLELAADAFEARMEDIELREGKAFVRGVPGRGIAIAKLAETAEHKGGGPGPIVGEGRSAPEQNAPGFVAHIAEVHVDRDTGRVTPLRYAAIQDVGFALNPTLVEGQIHGGSAQGIGWGLYEALRYDEHGELLTASLMDYTLPRAASLPTIEAVIVENPSGQGPFGVRGVGEPPITAGAAALANAVHAAVGARVNEIPLRDEVVWKAIQAAE